MGLAIGALDQFLTNFLGARQFLKRLNAFTATKSADY